MLCSKGDPTRLTAEHRAMHPWERSAHRLAELDLAAAAAGKRRWVEKARAVYSPATRRVALYF